MPRTHWLALVTLSLGCVPDTSRTPRGLACTESGGAWMEVADCPSACSPPPPTAENCATNDEQACITVCAEEPDCHCPDTAPFWLDGQGCVGFSACPDADTGA